MNEANKQLQAHYVTSPVVSCLTEDCADMLAGFCFCSAALRWAGYLVTLFSEGGRILPKPTQYEVTGHVGISVLVAVSLLF